MIDIADMLPNPKITHLEETPLRLHSFDNPDTRSSTLLVGDHAGCLSAISFPQFCFTARPFKEHARFGPGCGHRGVCQLRMPFYSLSPSLITAEGSSTARCSASCWTIFAPNPFFLAAFRICAGLFTTIGCDSSPSSFLGHALSLSRGRAHEMTDGKWKTENLRLLIPFRLCRSRQCCIASRCAWSSPPVTMMRRVLSSARCEQAVVSPDECTTNVLEGYGGMARAFCLTLLLSILDYPSGAASAQDVGARPGW